MKERILTGWTFQRALFLLMGVMIIIQSIAERQWIGMVFGCYFASMGLFSFGCASGACYPNSYSMKTQTREMKSTHDIEFEEIRNK